MSTAMYDLAASSAALGTTGAFLIGGLVVVCALIWAVRIGMRVMDRELTRPRAQDQPHLPPTGAVVEEREVREPDVVRVSSGSTRLMPYELHHSPSRRSPDQHRPRWVPGSSGAFGSGGPGHV
ncbi:MULTISPECIES: DUF6479 family protein [unclassified Streptomyces]|uniref:DUF6479 family protein n=1 Tax=unclassified Streptomyces TaxID=2593676 RepID=UPI00136FB8C9|nr:MULTISPECIES: DUF6479 family protein [unclassified Streptomyces]MCW5249894.1 hypothetical protein [Streptomyces sp. SHP 1-2]MYU22391.1 hypothetical protein [Streptomyces sp. SID8352]